MHNMNKVVKIITTIENTKKKNKLQKNKLLTTALYVSRYTAKQLKKCISTNIIFKNLNSQSNPIL